MKCSICGYKGKDIGAIGKHYRKMHPKIMARRKNAKANRESSMTKKTWNMIGKGNGWL